MLHCVQHDIHEHDTLCTLVSVDWEAKAACTVRGTNHDLYKP